MALVATGNIKDKKTVSENWHRTQVFIYYNKANFDKDRLNCLGTILSCRFILTAATCVLNSNVPLKNVILYHDKKSYHIEKYTIHQKFHFGATFPDLAVLKLTKDIESKNLISMKKLIHLYPQDKPGMYLNLNVKTVKYVLPTVFLVCTCIFR